MIRPLAVLLVLVTNFSYGSCSLVADGQSTYRTDDAGDDGSLYLTGIQTTGETRWGVGYYGSYRPWVDTYVSVYGSAGTTNVDLHGPGANLVRVTSGYTATPLSIYVDNLMFADTRTPVLQGGSYRGSASGYDETGYAEGTKWTDRAPIFIRSASGSGKVLNSVVGATNVSSTKCDALMRLTPPLVVRSNTSVFADVLRYGTSRSVLLNGRKYFLITTTPARLVVPIRVETSPANLDYGVLRPGTTGSIGLDVKVHAPSRSPHKITFEYTSGTRTPEVVTIDHKGLPHVYQGVIPDGQSYSNIKFNAQITSSVAGDVNGRLVITAQLT